MKTPLSCTLRWVEGEDDRDGWRVYLVLQDDGVGGVLDGAFVETPLEVD